MVLDNAESFAINKIMNAASSSLDEVILRKIRVIDVELLFRALKHVEPDATREQLRHLRPVLRELRSQVELKKQQ